MKPEEWFCERRLGKRSGFINHKDAVTEKWGGIERRKLLERLKRPQEGLNNPPVAGRYRYVMRLVVPFPSATD